MGKNLKGKDAKTLADVKAWLNAEKIKDSEKGKNGQNRFCVMHPGFHRLIKTAYTA